MTCSTSVVTGPELELVRGARNVIRIRTIRNGSPIDFSTIASELFITVAEDIGINADIVMRLSTNDSSEIAVAPGLDNSYLDVNFGTLLTLTADSYWYAVWIEQAGFDPEPFTMPTRIRIVESVGP